MSIPSRRILILTFRKKTCWNFKNKNKSLKSEFIHFFFETSGVKNYYVVPQTFNLYYTFSPQESRIHFLVGGCIGEHIDERCGGSFQ